MEFHQFELLAYGIYDSRIKHTSGAFSPERTVGFYEIEIFTGATDSISFINGVAYPHEAGRIICAKPGQKRYSKLHFSCYYLHVLPKNEKAKKLLESLPDSIMVGDTGEYIKTFNKMISTGFADSDMKELYIAGALSKLLRLVMMDSNMSELEAGVIGNKKALLKAEKHLIKNYQNNITLEQLSAVANISPIYFHKLFTSYFHKTPNKYLLDLRISHAKIKLLEEEYNLSDIALECGFSSQSYFCYKFKAVTGLSPLQYRKSELGKIEI